MSADSHPTTADVKAILLDIGTNGKIHLQGYSKLIGLGTGVTVCSISFVRDTLFPYALDVLSLYLKDNWTTPEFAPYRAAFPENVRDDPAKLEAYVRDLSAKDLKVPCLKQLQGLLWRTGYENGAIVCPLYDDVHPALTRWHLEGKKLYIYSSGSIAAQKLLFAHTNCNPKDINVLFENYYDTTNAGMKQEQQSYSTIAEKESIPAEDWLFLSDNVKEVGAARAAGMKSRVVLREGNAEVSAEDKEKLGAVEEFSGL